MSNSALTRMKLKKVRQEVAQRKQLASIVEAKVQTLKDQLSNISRKYVMDTYQLLAEIYDLRKSVDKHYNFMELWKEVSVIFDKYSQVLQIMRLNDATPKTKEIIEQNKMSVHLVTYLLNQCSVLRSNASVQDRFFAWCMEQKGKTHQHFIMALTQLNKSLKAQMESIELTNPSITTHDKLKFETQTAFKEIKVLNSKVPSHKYSLKYYFDMIENVLEREWVTMSEEERENIRAWFDSMQGQFLSGKR